MSSWSSALFFIATTVLHGTPSAASQAYNWIYIVLAALTMVGMGIAAAKWLKKQGATEAAVKNMLSMHSMLQKLVDANVLERLSNQDDVLADISRAIRPNGLDTNEVGDMVRRTEIKVERIEAKIDVQANKLSEHIGAAVVEEREIWRAIKELQK